MNEKLGNNAQKHIHNVHIKYTCKGLEVKSAIVKWTADVDFFKARFCFTDFIFR